MVDIVDISEMHPLSKGKSGKRYGSIYPKYEEALRPEIPEILNLLKGQEFIRISKDEMVNRYLGPLFQQHGERSLQMGMQYVLWKQDIVVGIRTRTDGQRVFELRKRRKSDALPLWMQISKGQTELEHPRI